MTKERDSDQTTWVPASAPIDITAWNWGEGYDEGLAGLLMKGAAARISEVLKSVFESDPPRVSFPFAWGRVTDPVMLHVDLPFNDESGNACVFAVSLEGCVDDLLDLERNLEGKVASDKGENIVRKVAARLRELADKLDNACS